MRSKLLEVSGVKRNLKDLRQYLKGGANGKSIGGWVVEESCPFSYGGSDNSGLLSMMS